MAVDTDPGGPRRTQFIQSARSMTRDYRGVPGWLDRCDGSRRLDAWVGLYLSGASRAPLPRPPSDLLAGAEAQPPTERGGGDLYLPPAARLKG
jgi:hypothetical protein